MFVWTVISLFTNKPTLHKGYGHPEDHIKAAAMYRDLGRLVEEPHEVQWVVTAGEAEMIQAGY
jgi:hypothetical protein